MVTWYDVEYESLHIRMASPHPYQQSDGVKLGVLGGR